MDYLTESSARLLRELPLFSQFTDREPEAHTAQGHMAGNREQGLNSGGLIMSQRPHSYPSALLLSFNDVKGWFCVTKLG